MDYCLLHTHIHGNDQQTSDEDYPVFLGGTGHASRQQTLNLTQENFSKYEASEQAPTKQSDSAHRLATELRKNQYTTNTSIINISAVFVVSIEIQLEATQILQPGSSLIQRPGAFLGGPSLPPLTRFPVPRDPGLG